jgi:hypothetical protein
MIRRNYRAYFDLVNSKRVQHPGNLDSLLDGERNARVLLALSQGAVQNPDSFLALAIFSHPVIVVRIVVRIV